MHREKPNLIFGALLCTLGYLFIAIMGACSKLVSLEVPVVVILFFQNLICLLLLLPEIFIKGWHTLKTKRIGLHLMRDVMGTLSFFSLFLALKKIPLVDGVLLQNTAPLWIPLVVLIWLKVHMHGHLWWGMVVGFLGVVLILKPSAGIIDVNSLLGVASGIFLAVSLVAIRRLTSTEPTHRILFFYFLFGTLVTSPFALTELAALSQKSLFLLIGVGVSMFIAQTLITYSFTHGKASTFAPIAYSAVIYSGILGWFIWHHLPDLLSSIGLILVIIGGILSIYFEKKYEKRMVKK
jgi:drug/metabolite transporter (DMT)-like permease